MTDQEQSDDDLITRIHQTAADTIVRNIRNAEADLRLGYSPQRANVLARCQDARRRFLEGLPSDDAERRESRARWISEAESKS